MLCSADVSQHFNRTLLKHYRKKKYKTRKAFASVIGVSDRTAQAWEMGEKKPSLTNLKKIASELEIDPEDLLNESGKHIWNLWLGHLLDYVLADPEVIKETKTETREGDPKVGVEIRGRKVRKRQLKLTAKEAIDLAEKLGIFEREKDKDETQKDLSEIFNVIGVNDEDTD